jgi:hypothetical protein
VNGAQQTQTRPVGQRAADGNDQVHIKNVVRRKQPNRTLAQVCDFVSRTQACSFPHSPAPSRSPLTLALQPFAHLL